MSIERILSWGAFASVLLFSMLNDKILHGNEVGAIAFCAGLIGVVEYLNKQDHSKYLKEEIKKMNERISEQDKIIAENRSYISQVKMNKSLGRQ